MSFLVFLYFVIFCQRVRVTSKKGNTMKILKENIMKTISVILMAATIMLMPKSAFGLITGFNVEITNNTGRDAYDFHLEGTLQSLDVVNQVANFIMPWPAGSIPHFDWTYDGGNITPAPNTIGKYYYSGGWSGTVPVPPGGTIHIGKYWDETCNNKVVDLRGWWTDRSGKKINPHAGTMDGGYWISDVPLLGFDIEDNIPARLDNPDFDISQTVTVQNATNHKIQIESPQMAITDMHISLDELVPDGKVLNSLEWYDANDVALDGFNNTILPGRSIMFDLGRIGLTIHPGQETILRCRMTRVGTNEWRFYAAKCTAHSIHDKNPVGIFEDATDVGGPAGIGSTVYEGYVWGCGVLSEQYLLTGDGTDIWGNSDEFHYAYNTVSGDVRLSACFEWVVYCNDWAKYGVMLRNSLNPGSVHRFMCERGLADYAGMQGRVDEGGPSSEFGTAWTIGAKALGIQRVTIEGLTFIEGLADFGNGWESRAINLVLSGFEDEILAGVAITSHNNNCLAQARCWNVQYEANPDLVGEFSAPTVPSRQVQTLAPARRILRASKSNVSSRS
jgi:hypothetical protein